MYLNLGVLTFVQFLYIVEANVKGISCFTCTSSVRNPLKCTKPEYLGTYKKCTVDGMVQSTSCYKSVNTKTGEVNKGCAPMASIKALVSDDGTGLNTFYCNTSQCNGATQWTSFLIGPVMGIYLIWWGSNRY